MKAIESGEPTSVSSVLEELTLQERRRELTAECAGTGGRQGDGAGSPLSAPRATATAMLPIFHAASLGNLGVFLAVLGGLKGSLADAVVSKPTEMCPRCAMLLWYLLYQLVVERSR